MAALNDRIKEMRTVRGLTLLDVAERLGVKEATMQRYESGRIKNIKHETILTLAEIFNCSPSYLMGWEDEVGGVEVMREDSYTPDEQQLLRDYRALSDQGKEYMRQTMVMALHTYKKDCSIPDMEATLEIG